MKPTGALFVLLSIHVALLSSCSKDNEPTDITTAPPPAAKDGMYVLSTNTIISATSLQYYNFATRSLGPDIFSSADGSNIGYGVVDMAIYGSKIYLADNGLNYLTSCTPSVDVLDGKTGKLLAQMPYTSTGPATNGVGSVSRLTAFQGSVFVSNSNGSIAEIDTSSLVIKRYAPVGDFPVGGMAVANGQLYCALNNVESDSVAVLDLATLSLKKEIRVLDQPANIVADPSGNIYAFSIDDDDAFNIPDSLGLGSPSNPSPGGYSVIDSRTNLVHSKTLAGIGFTPCAAFFKDALYFLADNDVHVFNTQSQTIVNSNLVTVGGQRDILTHINVHPTSGEIFVALAGLATPSPTGTPQDNPATVDVFDVNGKPEYSFQAAHSSVIRTGFYSK